MVLFVPVCASWRLEVSGVGVAELRLLKDAGGGG